MKEADKRARITVAYGGLILLLDQLKENPKYKSPRSRLFGLPKGEDRVPENIKAIRTKAWQRDYLQRLLEAGLLIKVTESGQELYQAESKEAIAALIADHDNYGLRLSRFLFPREAGMPPELDEDIDDEEDEEEDIEEEDEEEQLETKTTDGPVAGQVSLEVSGDSLKKLINLLNEVVEQREMSIKLFKAILDQYKLVEESVQKDREERQADRELPNYFRNRLKDLDNRMSKMEEALNFSGRTLTRVDAAINTLSSTVGSLMNNLNHELPFILAEGLMKGLINVLGLSHGQTLLGTLSTQIQALERRGSLRDTLAEFRVRLQDLRAVEELALKAVESTEKSEVTDER